MLKEHEPPPSQLPPHRCNRPQTHAHQQMIIKKDKPKHTNQEPSAEAPIETWNKEDSDELHITFPSEKLDQITVSSRDWTVETIVSQISSGNINLDPDFQRRNAWQDARRSKLIESFILGFPVPQIVLAESPSKKKSFIVIDGKQRLMTIASLYLDEYRSYWNKPKFQGLRLLEPLNNVSIDSFLEDDMHGDKRRQLANADIRTTVISGFDNETILYDIFYRLNTGSVPLSSQELRQVLHRGDFSRYLIQVTDKENPLWEILRLTRPDSRLRDVELLLRLISITLFSYKYSGNLKQFLDDSLSQLNNEWHHSEEMIKDLTGTIFSAVSALIEIFGDNAGKKFREDGSGYERQINRAVFEVQAYFLLDHQARILSVAHKAELRDAFEVLCMKDPIFRSSVEATTKSIENYQTRFSRYQIAAGKAIGHTPPPLPI